MMNTNSYSYFLITLWILLIIRSSPLINSKFIGYPSFVNAPNSWTNNLSFDFSFWEVAGVKPILVNGIFVCGFHCSLVGESCLFAISIFNTSTLTDNPNIISPQVIWSANRNNPVEYQALLQLTPQGNLTLKDADGSLVWSPFPGTLGKYVANLNLSAEGNLMLFDKTNHMVWQSFDHPTDSLVLGQGLVEGQQLLASVSTSNSSDGFYAFAIIDGLPTAYMEADPSQIYYSWVDDDFSVQQSYFEFQNGKFVLVEDSARFVRLGSDGHLRAFEWIETESRWNGTDLLGINRCDYPLACGKYGVCSEGGCSCITTANQSETAYFSPINYSIPDLGCRTNLPISCELSLYQRMLEVQGISYVAFPESAFYSNDHNKSSEDCKEACLKNCSCQAAIYGEYDKQIYPNQNRKHCYFPSEVFSFKVDSFSYYSFFIKVQHFPIEQSFNKNVSLSESPRRKRQGVAVIVGSILGVTFGVFVICTFLIVQVKKGFKEVEEDYIGNISGMPTRFSYEELKNMTKNFSNKLGKGGFGSVFHGTLPSGSEVAVKHLDGFGRVDKSFIAEVQTVGSIQHFNLVSLVGFCAEKYNRLLVYEYMPNGSLDQWIFDKNQELALGWEIRKKIILNVAKGLAYLHEDCNHKIVHLDIKPQNILVDENFNAKVSDFGLSKLIGRDESQIVTTMRGTPGYMAPEWLSSVITEKADVYSFGIVVLEILCGRRNVDGSQPEEDRHLLGLFKRKEEEGTLVDLVDKCCEDMQSNAAEVVEMMKVASWCLQTEYARRPSMSMVVKFFEGSADFVGNMNDNIPSEPAVFEAMVTSSSSLLPSILSGPR